MTKTVAVIGAGLIGRAWAMVFARAGWRVRLNDNSDAQLQAARAFIGDSLVQQANYGLATDPAAALARIEYVAHLPDAVADVDWVQENLPEVVEVKREVFACARYATHRQQRSWRVRRPRSPRRNSPRSSLGRARCLVAHPVNPPHLVPIVELCGAPWTSPATIARAQAVYDEVGQVPIIVRRELDGFILNRLQGALLSEAMRLVGEGYVSPEDLDKTIRDGLGLRWAFMGPFATIELNAPGGVVDYCARYSAFYRRLAADPPQPSVWEAGNAAIVGEALGPPRSQAELEARTRWRDRRLMALVAHKKQQAEFD